MLGKHCATEPHSSHRKAFSLKQLKGSSLLDNPVCKQVSHCAVSQWQCRMGGSSQGIHAQAVLSVMDSPAQDQVHRDLRMQGPKHSGGGG
jgi:conjugal transfer/entry exclusion protein